MSITLGKMKLGCRCINLHLQMVRNTLLIFLGGDCYGVVTSCKKDEKGVSYHLEVEFDISTAKFHFSKCYAHEVLALSIISITLWANRIYHVYG